MLSRTPATLVEMLKFSVEEHQKQDAIRFKEGGQWMQLSSVDLLRRVRDMALGLYRHGLRKGDRVALMAESGVYWAITDYAILSNGAATVPIFPTQALSQVKYILQESQPKLLIVSTRKLLSRIESVLAELPELKVALIEPADHPSATTTFEKLSSDGHSLFTEQPDLFEKITSSYNIHPGDLASIIYTSGTTGEPKGVMLSHDNFIFDAIQTGLTVCPTREDIGLSFLPLSHIFERTVVYLYLMFGVTICFAESVETVAENLLEIRPTIMTSVPRMFEKVYDRILRKAASLPKHKKKLFDWALKVGLTVAKRQDAGLPAGMSLGLKYRLASKLVFSKWRDAVGGRVRSFISGGAALRPEIAYAFWGAGIPVLQGYGLTETSPVVCVNTLERNRMGTVGPPMPQVEVQLGEDGEILVRGRLVMLGYYNKPGETREVLTGDGWFKTGDIGEIDQDGYVKITDRKKDLIRLNIGKFLAPQPIEAMIARCPLVEQVVVIGNQRKFPVALIVPKLQALRDYAASRKIDSNDLCSDPRILAYFREQVDQLTSDLGEFERIKKVALLDQEFSIEGGELTPTLKIRRKVIEEKHKERIDSLYPRSGLSAAAS